MSKKTVKPALILLGSGDKVVESMVTTKGLAGFSVANLDGSHEVGVDPGPKADDEEIYFAILTRNPKSLGVVIAACECAKKWLEKNPAPQQPEDRK